MLDVSVPEISLNRSSINAFRGELIALGVAEHVRVDGEFDAGFLACPGDHVKCRSGAHRTLPLGAKVRMGIPDSPGAERGAPGSHRLPNNEHSSRPAWND